MLKFWTDGSAVPNPGKGGFAVIGEDGKPVFLGGSSVADGFEVSTTNIRMEARGIIEAMRIASGEPVTIYTDSQFWVNVWTVWSLNWARDGWKKKGGEIKNLDLVREGYELYRKGNVRLKWVRGHAQDPLNESADEWANRAREGVRI